MGYPYNHLVAAPGNLLLLGAEGGSLLLSPPGEVPGAMTLDMMMNKTWHLLRENGPDTGQAQQTVGNGDFPNTVLMRDLNLALAKFISDTGLAPDLTDRQDTFPIFSLLDMPVPPSLKTLTKIEYNPAGGYTYTLIGLDFSEFDEVTGLALPPIQGQPRYYRQPWAGYIRLQPQPGPGQVAALFIGNIFSNGAVTPGDLTTVTLSAGAAVVNCPYVTQSGDTLETVMENLASIIQTSAAVVGSSPFITIATASGNEITLNASITAPPPAYKIATTSSTMTVTPTMPTQMTPDGDTMTWYYSSLGNVLALPGDVPGIPPEFHIAPVYSVLVDYWQRKNDKGQSAAYAKRYAEAVARGKAQTFDVNRSTQPTIAGAEDWDVYPWPLGIG